MRGSRKQYAPYSMCALACVDGRLNPGPTLPEKMRWLEAIMGTAEHYRRGVHRVGDGREAQAH